MRLGVIQLSAIVASLLLSGGLVLRVSATLSPVAPETRSDTAAVQAIQLRDGANGVTLFQEVGLAPGHSESRCITVRATGTRTPDRVTMVATSGIDPALAPWLHLEVLRGPPLGDGRSCEGFVSRETVLSGQSNLVLTALASGVGWEPRPGEEIPGGHGTAYQLTATLLPDAPNEIQGAAMDFDLVWSTAFDPAGSGWLARTLALAIRFTEDSMIPMLAIFAMAVLYLGVQDRLDTATPRLSQAALFDEVIEFDDHGAAPGA